MPFASLLGLVLVAGPVAEVELRAERLLHDEKHGLTTAEGSARLRASNAAVDADRIVYERESRRVTAVGHVTARLAEGGLVGLVAESVTLRLDGDRVEEAWLLEGHAEVHLGVTPEAFLAAATPEALADAGTITTVLRGNHLVRQGTTWHVDRAEVVPCDCDLKHPSWAIHASSADVDPDAQRISTWWPRVWVGPVPLLGFPWVPWLSLPMTDRQTGLLFPKPATSSLNGFGLELPFYVTLGRSADVTLTPGYFFGAAPPKDSLQPPYGVKGPHLGVEFRYAPAQGVEGRLFGGIIDDFRLERDPALAGAVITGSPRGLRGDLGWLHRQKLGHGLTFNADLNLNSDGYYLKDFTSDVLGREAGYLRSSAVLTHRTTDTSLSLDLGYRQDVRFGYQLFGLTPRPEGSAAPVYGPNTLQRTPALTFALAPKLLIDGLAVSVTGSFVRQAPWGGLMGDEGSLAGDGRLVDPATGTELSSYCLQQRLFMPASLLDTQGTCGVSALDKAGQGDRLFQRGEREARDRVDVLPKLLWAAQPFGALSLSAFAGWRQDAWRGELTGEAGQRGHPVLGARAETSLVGEAANGSLRHSITPAVELRSVPLVLGSQPAPYDAVDLAVPDARGRLQGQAVLEQRLTRPLGGDLLRLDLGQGFDLASPEASGPRLSESFGRLLVSLGWLSAGASARVDPYGVSSGLRLTRASAGFGLDDWKGDGLSFGYESVLDEGTARTRRPLDLLFGTPLPATAQTRSHVLTAGARARFKFLSLRYDLLAMSQPADSRDANPGLVLLQQVMTLGVTPACDCWRVDVYARHAPTRASTDAPLNFLVWPELGFNVSVSRFGSIGSSR